MKGGKGISWDPKAATRDDVVSWSSVDTDFEGWETDSFSPLLGGGWVSWVSGITISKELDRWQ